MIRLKENRLIIEISDKKAKKVVGEIIEFAEKRMQKTGGEDILDMIEQYHCLGRGKVFKRDDIYNERL